jgi:hypothetical protein
MPVTGRTEVLHIKTSARVYQDWHDIVNELRYRRKVAKNNSEVLNLALAALREKMGIKKV